MDRTLEVAYKHSCDWRYDFNPKKYAILVYGETKDQYKSNSQNRIFRLGPHQIKEKSEYEHVGVKSCVFEYEDCIIADRLAKA